MSSTTDDRQAIIEELAAAIEARRELGDRMEPHVVESFVAKIESSIDRRVDERLAVRQPQPRQGRVSSPVVFWSLVFGVGATAIVSDMSAPFALVAILVIWTAIAAINVAHARGRR